MSEGIHLKIDLLKVARSKDDIVENVQPDFSQAVTVKQGEEIATSVDKKLKSDRCHTSSGSIRRVLC